MSWQIRWEYNMNEMYKKTDDGKIWNWCNFNCLGQISIDDLQEILSVAKSCVENGHWRAIELVPGDNTTVNLYGYRLVTTGTEKATAEKWLKKQELSEQQEEERRIARDLTELKRLKDLYD